MLASSEVSHPTRTLRSSYLTYGRAYRRDRCSDKSQGGSFKRRGGLPSIIAAVNYEIHVVSGIGYTVIYGGQPLHSKIEAVCNL